MKIYLTRHGESVGNKKEVVYGSTDYDLTDLGLEQAKILGEKLSKIDFKRCYTSELKRAYTTAQILLEGRNIEIIRNKALNEQDFGIYENQKIDFTKDGDNYESAVNRFVRGEIPQGESYEQMSKRAIDFVKSILKEDENNLIVAHSGPLGALTAALLGLPLSYARHFSYYQGTFTLIELRYGVAKLRYFNK